MWNYILISLSIIVMIIVLANYLNDNGTEHFNEQSGQFCSSCKDKTFNQCLNCFNCGFCVDEWGNSQCIGSDIANGPYNNEKCARLYQGDPWLRMKENNQNYEIEFGPKQGNRVIGVNPCGTP